MTRQMKRVGDLCLLAGSPLDARGHYRTAIQTGSQRLGEQITAASAHEGMAAAMLLHICCQDGAASTILERYDQCASGWFLDTCLPF